MYRINLIQELFYSSPSYITYIDKKFGINWKKEVDMPWSEIPRTDPVLLKIVELDGSSMMTIVDFPDGVPFKIRTRDNATEYIEPDWRTILHKTFKGELTVEERTMYEKMIVGDE